MFRLGLNEESRGPAIGHLGPPHSLALLPLAPGRNAGRNRQSLRQGCPPASEEDSPKQGQTSSFNSSPKRVGSRRAWTWQWKSGRVDVPLPLATALNPRV